MTPNPVPPVVAPVSPTGAPTLPQSLIRIAGPVVGLLAVIGFAPDALKAAGVAMPALPALGVAIIAWSKVIAVLAGGYLGINSQGKRIIAPMLLAFILVTSCAANKVALAGASENALGRAYLVAGATLDDAYRRHAISEAQYAPWRSFANRWPTIYDPLDDALQAAVKSSDQPLQAAITAAFATLSGELAGFGDLVASAQLDGGAP